MDSPAVREFGRTFTTNGAGADHIGGPLRRNPGRVAWGVADRPGHDLSQPGQFQAGEHGIRLIARQFDGQSHMLFYPDILTA
jgi:hypothetical protein